MSDVIRWSAEVTVPDGPTVSVTSSFVAAGYDVTEATVAADDTPVTIPIMPGAWADVALIAITATPYDAEVTYDLGVAIGVALDGPQVFIGAGMLSLLSGAEPDEDTPTELVVTNAADDPVSVTVVVGRRPPP